MDSGELCVITHGTQRTQMWLADNLGFLMLHFQPTIVQAVIQGEISIPVTSYKKIKIQNIKCLTN